MLESCLCSSTQTNVRALFLFNQKLNCSGSPCGEHTLPLWCSLHKRIPLLGLHLVKCLLLPIKWCLSRFDIVPHTAQTPGSPVHSFQSLSAFFSQIFLLFFKKVYLPFSSIEFFLDVLGDFWLLNS